eukprot:6173246-Pleurochrysis_carterae.AAC.1
MAEGEGDKFKCVSEIRSIVANKSTFSLSGHNDYGSLEADITDAENCATAAEARATSAAEASSTAAEARSLVDPEAYAQARPAHLAAAGHHT